MSRKPMPVSSWWMQGAILTFLFGFSVLGMLAYFTYAQQPPIPGKVVRPDGTILFTRQDILEGMNVFERYGVMEYGTIYGHGAYLGPDFTAQYLHQSARMLVDEYSSGASADGRVAHELHTNTYDPTKDTLVWSDARAAAHVRMLAYYRQFFLATKPEAGAQARWIPEPTQIDQLSDFFAWSAWTAATNRPGHDYSYTNNWPPEPLAGNYVTADAVTWSVVSIIFLIGGTGLVLFFFGHYDWLGWTASPRNMRFIDIRDVAITPAQRATLWFLLISSSLFLGQTMLGGLIAHYRVEPGSFYGWDLSRVLPYNLARTWHLQLAIFWVSSSYLAAGIFVTPLIAGREPKGQGALTLILVSALVVVVVGSLIGEYASIQGWLKRGWFWVGDQGWEFIDLGRLWQILLTVGLFIWVAILWRGLRNHLRQESYGNLPWLLFYAALSIPVFYAVGLLASPSRGFVVTDFWRFWVVHLWVEDFLELFTTVIVAYLFVLLGLVQETTAVRVVYLDIILYSIGGVIGTMHHVYFSGEPALHMAFGASFSAMEVIPLLLLTLEAWSFVRSGERSIAGTRHPHQWAIWFLVATGFWNFLGAGVFGFLINLPVVSYYEIGTNLTANHAHGAMMGVYGMLAVGLLLFCLRYLMHPDYWSDRLAKISFWSLNLGLAWMVFLNLLPEGLGQLYDAVASGYWRARTIGFHMTPWVRAVEWLRLPGDVLFIIGGVVPIWLLCLRAALHPNPVQTVLDIPEQLYTVEAQSEAAVS
jgi:nitric oxide reductase subunit B